MSRAALAAAALAAACGGGATDRIDLDLQAKTGVGECGLIEVRALSSLAIDLYGLDPSGNLCLIERACVTLGDESSVEELEARLRSLEQPLVSGDAELASQVAIIGHAAALCGGSNPSLCGFASLADADQGTLPVTVQCDLVSFGPCMGNDPPACP